MRSTFFLLLFLSLINLLSVSVSCASFTEYVYPNFTASNLRFIDSSKGAFLFSRNSIFKAGLFSPGDDDSSSNFYFSVIHVSSGSTIWSANRDFPISSSGKMNLTPQGISVIEDGKSQIPVWSSQEVEKLVRIALCCVHEEPALRPTMAAVVGMFEGSIPLGIPRMESLNFLKFYGLRFAESSMVEGQNEESETLVFHRRESSNSGGSRHSASYIASQEVSGPR